MVNFAGGEVMLELRASGEDRYALVLTASGRLELRRYRAGQDVARQHLDQHPRSQIVARVLVHCAGTVPVTLTGRGGRRARISATDSSASALSASGAAGIAAPIRDPDR